MVDGGKDFCLYLNNGLKFLELFHKLMKRPKLRDISSVREI